MIYLASPYSHPDPAVRESRYMAVCRAAANLICQRYIVFSPIVHSHGIALHGNLAGDWNTWREFDLWFITRCDKLIILKLDGWKESAGIKAEIEIAERLGKPIEFIEPKPPFFEKLVK